MALTASLFYYGLVTLLIFIIVACGALMIGGAVSRRESRKKVNKTKSVIHAARIRRKKRGSR